MKRVLPFMLLIAGAGLMQASIVETIDLNLSTLHAGSMLSGTFTLPNAVVAGDTAPVVLTFSDPSDYTPTSLMATITIETGTPSGFAVVFSPLTFTNLSGSTTPIDTKDVNLTPFAFAMCASFPCTSSGMFQDGSPAVFNAAYTIAPAPAAVPEPSYAFAAPILMAVIIFGRRFVRPAEANRS
jgi:hypothetical protein